MPPCRPAAETSTVPSPASSIFSAIKPASSPVTSLQVAPRSLVYRTPPERNAAYISLSDTMSTARSVAFSGVTKALTCSQAGAPPGAAAVTPAARAGAVETANWAQTAAENANKAVNTIMCLSIWTALPSRTAAPAAPNVEHSTTDTGSPPGPETGKPSPAGTGPSGQG